MIMGAHLFSLTPVARGVLNKINKFKAICREIISARKASFAKRNLDSVHKDLLDLMLEQQINTKEEAFADEEIIDEFISFFMAGMDTTGHLLALMSYNVLENPEHLKRLREEIHQYYEGHDVSIENLNKLEYMSMVMKESLRFNTPVVGIFPREALVDHMLGDVKVKKGNLVGVSQQFNNFNEKNFENPWKYDPERWSNERQKARNLDPFSFIPFVAGGRNCIGQHLSQLEMKIIFCEFLRRFEYKVVEGYEHVMTSRFLYEPEDALKYDLKKRG